MPDSTLPTYSSDDLAGPNDHLTGDLALEADLALCEVILNHVFQGPETQAEALDALRLMYWRSFYDRCGLWMSTMERDTFDATIEGLRSRTDLPMVALEAARLHGEQAALGGLESANSVD